MGRRAPEQTSRDMGINQPYSLEEIIGLTAEAKRERGSLMEREDLKNSSDIFERRYAEEQRIIQQLIEKLEGERSRFKHVVVTSRGSRYFTLNTGQTLRIRATFKSDNPPYSRDGFSVEDHEISEQVFFIPASSFQVVKDLLAKKERGTVYKGGALIGVEIPVVPPSVGSHPFEVNFVSQPRRKNHVEIKDGVLVLRGSIDYRGELDNELAGPMHLGHAIQEVVKG